MRTKCPPDVKLIFERGWRLTVLALAPAWVGLVLQYHKVRLGTPLIIHFNGSISNSHPLQSLSSIITTSEFWEAGGAAPGHASTTCRDKANSQFDQERLAVAGQALLLKVMVNRWRWACKSWTKQKSLSFGIPPTAGKL